MYLIVVGGRWCGEFLLRCELVVSEQCCFHRSAVFQFTATIRRALTGMNQHPWKVFSWTANMEIGSTAPCTWHTRLRLLHGQKQKVTKKGPAAFTKVWLVLFWSRAGWKRHNTTGLKCSSFVGRSGRKAKHADVIRVVVKLSPSWRQRDGSNSDRARLNGLRPKRY